MERLTSGFPVYAETEKKTEKRVYAIEYFPYFPQ